MTDKELLELAAKAAGINTLYWTKDGQKLVRRDGGIQKPWNPLTDDGDALRLAVKLKLVVDIGELIIGVIPSSPKAAGIEECYAVGDDPYAATRRAIVRAAAAIGEKIK